MGLLVSKSHGLVAVRSSETRGYVSVLWGNLSVMLGKVIFKVIKIKIVVLCQNNI